MSLKLTNWLLENYGREEMRPGLDRIHAALNPIIHKLNQISVVTIAGTNGKGETTLRLSGELKDTPHLVWTSPHIERITERFRDQNGEIEMSDLERLIEKCHQYIQEKAISLSYYEFLFFVFCHWAIEKNPRYLLLEVGLGGRLDAVNVLDAKLVLLPSISRDHQEILGKRYELILNEKLGVLRSGATLYHMLDLKYLSERATKYAQKVSAQSFDLASMSKTSHFDFSARNAFLAHSAFLFLNGQSPNVDWKFSHSSLENRGEWLRSKNNYVFFGSHNTDGLRKLIQFLHSGNYTFPRPPFDRVIVAFSKRDERDLRSMLIMLKKANLGKIAITSFEHPKALLKEQAMELSRHEGLDFVFDIGQLVQGKNDQNFLVTGSYYFLSHFKQLLRGFGEA